MSKHDKKQQVAELRRGGLSVSAIAKKVNISKSTASLWCRDVPLTLKQKRVLKNNSINAGFGGRQKGANINRQKKLDIISSFEKQSLAQVGKLSNRDMLIAGASLYWAEGSKADTTSGFLFVNSDPAMILFIYKFLVTTLSVRKSDVVCTVQVNEVHKPRIGVILKFWSNLLELPLSQFNRTSFVKVSPKKVYENYDSYYGILRLKVKKSSNLKYRMLGLIKALKVSNMSA